MNRVFIKSTRSNHVRRYGEYINIWRSCSTTSAHAGSPSPQIQGTHTRSQCKMKLLSNQRWSRRSHWSHIIIFFSLTTLTVSIVIPSPNGCWLLTQLSWTWATQKGQAACLDAYSSLHQQNVVESNKENLCAATPNATAEENVAWN